MIYRYEYPRPMVTTDIIIKRTIEDLKQVLLIRRLNNPYVDHWALPGGFVDENEGLEDAAKRELFEETGLKAIKLKQFRTYGNPGRDPRGHSVSIVFTGNIKSKNRKIKAGDDAKDVQWFNLDALPPLAFDHEAILKDYLRK